MQTAQLIFRKYLMQSSDTKGRGEKNQGDVRESDTYNRAVSLAD